MKRIVNGKTYNTQTAVRITGGEAGHPSMGWWGLYQTRHGAFFKVQVDHDGEAILDFRPLTEVEARAELERHANHLVEEYFDPFLEVSGAERRLTIRVPGSLADRIEATAKEKGLSLNSYVMRCFEWCVAQNGPLVGPFGPGFTAHMRAHENLQLSASLSDIRERVHRKSQEYFTFDFNRSEEAKWRMFYGATDALLDAGAAAASYSRTIASDAGAKLLVCYGFLQALYIQQDAVRTLSRAVGLDWHPNRDERLRQIRDTRNRLSGHPARAGENEKPPRFSSAVIPEHDITPSRFRGHVYYDDETVVLDVDVLSFLKDNQERLATQMQIVEMKMDEAERQFRTEQATRPLSTKFEKGFSYLIQRLHCSLCDSDRLPQAKTHSKLIREVMNKLRRDLAERKFKLRTTSYHIDRILTGLDLLDRYMNIDTLSSNNQCEFDLIYDGVEKNIISLKDVICDIDARIRTPIA